MSARSVATPTATAPATPRKPGAAENDHDYLRRFVDPVLMPLIESLLLYQPESIYDFIHDYVDEEKATRFRAGGRATTAPNGGTVGYAKKVSNRRKMVDFMSTSVIPVMDDLAHQILREKPSSVKKFIKEIVAARIIVGSTSSITESNQQYEYADLKVRDRVECRYKGRPRYYPGVITAVDPTNDSFTVVYDDGKTEHNVHRMCIRPLEPQRKSSRSNSDGDNQTDHSGSGSSTTAAASHARVQRSMEIVILIIGIDGAGKTTLLSTLQGDLEKEHVPSAGFTSVAFQTETGSATFYDLGGGPAFRNVWREYYADAHGVMYVVDSSKEASLQEASQMLHAAMSHSSMTDKPLLVFANKRDQPGALPEEEVFHQLGLSHYHNAKLVPCVAKPAANGNMVDDRLEQGLHWLFDQVHGNFDELSARVRDDLAIKKRENDERREAQRLRVAAYKEERERSQMTLHDPRHGDTAQHTDKKRVITPEADDDVIKCSNCSTAPAVTKCSASKWMPVCGDCATSLKSVAATNH